MPDTLPAESLYVSLAAAKRYAQFRRHLGPEEARRELTRLLCSARRRPDGSYRHRSSTTRLDVTARVVREGPLFVVTPVHAREWTPGERGGRGR